MILVVGATGTLGGMITRRLLEPASAKQFVFFGALGSRAHTSSRVPVTRARSAVLEESRW
jgi:uncharacterized protein YbjT (DUF2867 family)